MASDRGLALTPRDVDLPILPLSADNVAWSPSETRLVALFRGALVEEVAVVAEFDSRYFRIVSFGTAH